MPENVKLKELGLGFGEERKTPALSKSPLDLYPRREKRKEAPGSNESNWRHSLEKEDDGLIYLNERCRAEEEGSVYAPVPKMCSKFENYYNPTQSMSER